MFKRSSRKDRKSDPEKLKKRKKRLLILAIFAGAFFIFMAGAVEFTSHSGFCAACHFMKPFFKSWEESSHSEFECSVCHYPPGGGIRSKLRKKIEGLVMVGRYWTKLYVKSKPWAEIKDESCLREGCHEKRLLEGKVQFKKVAFDHKIHFEDLKRGKRLQCTSCHSQIVQGEHITVTESSCFICHFKKSEFYPQIAECSHCHDRESLTGEASRYDHNVVFDNGFSCDKCHSNVIVGDGEVPRENCYKCHWEQERLGKYNDTDLMHTKHIYENKIECNQCHMDIQHKITKDIESIADCQSCHTDFHKAQKILYAGEGGKGAPHAMPNVMLEKGLSCKGCHVFHEESGGRLIKSDTFVSRAQACESCHGKGFARILKEWEASTAKKLTQINSILNQAQREIRQSNHPSKARAERLLEDAVFNIEIVDKGKSVHNVAYSLELLSITYQKLQEALKAIDSGYSPPPFQIAAEAIPTQCANCHAGIEEISSPVFGMNFPHKSHLLEQKINCSNCHSNVRRHGELTATKKSCAGCHHKDPEKDCSSCHRIQAQLYRGGHLNGLDVPMDIMAEGEVECSDCHTTAGEKIVRPDKSACVECHDEDYAEMFTEWQNSVRTLLQEVNSAIRVKRKSSLTEQEKQELAEIEGIIRTIRLDGSAGIHNYMFIEEVLTDINKKLNLH